MNPSAHYGLIGKTLSYSFSKKYFTEKFERENISADYNLFSFDKIEDVFSTIIDHKLNGFNVTIPYKEAILPFLDNISDEAKAIRAVNTVKITANGLVGHNTDAYGFKTSLKPFLKRHHRKALILGTGGASKAVKYVLDELGLESLFVSRTPKNDQEIAYADSYREKLLVRLGV